MNWKLTALLLGGYIGISYLRKRGAVTINKDDAAGKVLDQAANQGDQIVAVANQLKDTVAAKAGGAKGIESAGPTADEQALATIF